MDYKAIEQLIKTAGESGLTFLEIETEGIKITMKKGGEESAEKVEAIKPPEVSEVTAEKEEVNETKEAPKTFEDKNIVSVVSPIVGTFYSSSSPEAEDFVSVGSKVKKGQTLCIIEAMKLMNEIEAEVDGEIVEILAENEQMVEYGQEIFKIAIK